MCMVPWMLLVEEAAKNLDSGLGSFEGFDALRFSFVVSLFLTPPVAGLYHNRFESYWRYSN